MLIVAPEEGYTSLVSLEYAAAYMADFGHAWPNTAEQQGEDGPVPPDPVEVQKAEIALRKGTQYLQAVYSIDPQYLNPVHFNVQAACCEAALRAMQGVLLADVDGRTVVEQTVDVITTKYADNGQGGQKRFGLIDALMKSVTTGNGMTVKLVRG